MENELKKIYEPQTEFTFLIIWNLFFRTTDLPDCHYLLFKVIIHFEKYSQICQIYKHEFLDKSFYTNFHSQFIIINATKRNNYKIFRNYKITITYKIKNKW